MARQHELAEVECVEINKLSTKRLRTERETRTPRKRQKTVEQGINVQQLTQDQTFPFMKLPGEIRNRIYAYAAGKTYCSFPPMFPKDKRQRKYGERNTIPIPFLSLTQTSTLIRSEFRPIWLSTNQIPLFAIPTYLKTFYPHPNPKASIEAHRRLATQFCPSGSLRVWIRFNELENMNMLALIKHCIRFPEFKITLHALHTINPASLASLLSLINNKNERWVQGIRTNKISQVRSFVNRTTSIRPEIRVVAKERFAPKWMKAIGVQQRPPWRFEESLGLGELAKEWKIDYGVDYS